MHTPDRRRVLQAAAASAASFWLPRSAWSQPRLPAQPFALGVASGSPTSDGMVLWTRLCAPGFVGQPPQPLEQGPVTVRWELAHDEAFGRIVRSGQSQARPELAHSVHVELAGLEPDRWYFYRFMAGDAVSATGRTRTFPAADARPARLRLAYASCQNWAHGHYAAWRHAAHEDLDLVLFLGDYIYEYPGALNAVRPVPGGWVSTLDGYRARYALHRSDAQLQQAHCACPWMVTWDDHEVHNDYAGLWPGNSGPEVADFAARRAAAYQAYYEHMPLRAATLTRALAGLAQGAEMRIYASVPFGRLATITTLDERQYRDRQPCTRPDRPGGAVLDPAACPDWSDPRRSLLGAAQERWLDEVFAQAGQRGGGWSVIGQQTLLGQRDNQIGAGERFWNDGWDGYRAARTRLTDGLHRHRVPNPVVLGGDVHENWVGHVKADYARPDSDAVGVEFCGASITSRARPHAHLDALLAENPHFIFADQQRHGYGVVECTPQRLTTTLRVVSDVRRADATIETLARFEVQAGRPHIER